MLYFNVSRQNQVSCMALCCMLKMWDHPLFCGAFKISAAASDHQTVQQYWVLITVDWAGNKSVQLWICKAPPLCHINLANKNLSRWKLIHHVPKDDSVFGPNVSSKMPNKRSVIAYQASVRLDVGALLPVIKWARWLFIYLYNPILVRPLVRT